MQAVPEQRLFYWVSRIGLGPSMPSTHKSPTAIEQNSIMRHGIRQPLSQNVLLAVARTQLIANPMLRYDLFILTRKSCFSLERWCCCEERGEKIALPFLSRFCQRGQRAELTAAANQSQIESLTRRLCLFIALKNGTYQDCLSDVRFLCLVNIHGKEGEDIDFTTPFAYICTPPSISMMWLLICMNLIKGVRGWLVWKRTVASNWNVTKNKYAWSLST